MKPHLITILVLDDEDIIRAIGVRTLKHAGYRVLDAKGGQEATKTAKEHIGPIRLPLTANVMLFHPHPTNPDVVFAGIEVGGIVRSDDGGRTWHLAGDKRTAGKDAIHPDIHGLAISPSRPTMQVLYMSAFVGHASDLLEKNASFIAKPFKPSALLDAVQSTLASTVRNQQMRRRLA